MGTIPTEGAFNRKAPFMCNILNADIYVDLAGNLAHEASPKELAAVYRFGDDLVAPTRLERRFVEQELDVNRLHAIMQHLWIAGRPVPPRPLHYQLILGRDVVITERMDMHLIWGQGRIFLKPIPRFLLNPNFWETNVLSNSVDSDCGYGISSPDNYRSLRGCALGFLVSYTALIAHESDFYIAQNKHLIPREVSWKNWRIFVQQLLASSSNVQSEVADRFVYGELRLNRLNLIYIFLGSFRGYLPQWNSYASFYSENMQLVVGATVYIVVILTALQLGLTTNRLSNNEAFQAASYGFTVLSILGPLVAVGIFLLVFGIVVMLNLIWTRENESKRKQVLGRSWST